MSERHGPSAVCLALVLLFGGGAFAQPLTQAPPQPLSQAAAQPLTLEATIAGALEGPDVRLARLLMTQAEAAAASAGAVLSGTLRTGAQASWSAGPDPATSAELQPLSAQVTLNLVPYGPTFYSAERAREAAGDATEALEAAALQAALSAAERWWAAERAGRELAQARARVEAAERALQATLVQVEAGTAGAGAAVDAELALLQARLDATAAAADEAAALVAVEQVTGAPAPAVAARDEDLLDAATAWCATLQLPVDAELRSAADASARMRSAEAALRQALEAAERARRNAGPTASLSTSVSVSGESGRASLGAGIDTRSYQPSLELSVDPWSARPEAASATLSLSVTLPLGAASTAEIERADLTVALERERLASARTQAQLEFEATRRVVEQAAGQLQLALERLALRELQHQAVEVRAAAGTVAPLDLARSHRDLDEAELALARALDAARIAQARLGLDLGRTPFAALGLDATTQARLEALLEGILQEVR